MSRRDGIPWDTEKTIAVVVVEGMRKRRTKEALINSVIARNEVTRRSSDR